MFEEIDLQEVDRLLQPRAGWLPLTGHSQGPAAQSQRSSGVGAFVPWQANERLALRVYQRERDGVLVGRAWFGPAAMGPPGAAHGGAQAAILDHALGAAAWVAGYPSQTASYTHEYRKRLEISRGYDVVTSIDSVEGRKVRVSGRIQDSEDRGTVVYSEASALFIRFSDNALAQFAERVAASGERS